MRKDTSFSDRKLTVEEFSKKYWLGGEMPYQYHTGTIEDGRDEREQFLFNNVRALREMNRESNKRRDKKVSDMNLRLYRAEKKIATLYKINVAMAAIGILIFIISRMNMTVPSLDKCRGRRNT